MNVESDKDSLTPNLGNGAPSLRRAEVFLAEAMNALPDLVYVLDAAGRLVYWNRAVTACTGYSDNEVATMSPEDFFPEGDRERVRESIQRTWVDGRESIEVCICTKSAECVPYEFSGSLLHDEHGAPVAICGAGRNVSERKEFESALRDSERRFRTLFEASRDAMMVLGDGGYFITGNRAAIELFGCSSEAEFRQCTPADLSPDCQPDGQRSDSAAREMIEIAARDGSHLFEWLHRRLDGTQFEASVLLTRMELDGKTRIHATVRDISAERRVKRALEENERNLRTITESALDAVVMIDSKARIIHWNPAATTMFGYSADEVIGRNPHDFLAPLTMRGTAERGLEAFAVSGTGPAIGHVVELAALRKDGREFPIEVSVSPVQSEHGWAAVAILRDVSGRKQLEQSLKDRTVELTARVRELSCLERASKIFEESDLPPLDMIRRVVELLPEVVSESAAQGARILYQNESFCTQQFSETPFRLSVPLVVDETPVGALEVFPSDDALDSDNQPDFEQEYSLLEQLTARLGRAIERCLRHEEIRALNHKVELLLSATRTRFLLTDEECIVRYADPETQRLYGAVGNQRCSRYLFLTSGQCPGCPRVNPASRDRTVVSHFRLPLEQDRIFQRTSVPICTNAGEKMYAAVLIDVTEYRDLEMKLSQARKLEAVGQLAAGIAHEINTPTQFVGDNTRFLKESFNDLERVLDKIDRLVETTQEGVDGDLLEDVRATMNDIDTAFLRNEIPASIDQTLEGVAQIGRIVRAMKEFSHPGSGDKQAIDLNRAIENTLTVSRGEWKHVAELITDFDAELPMVSCLPADLNQALLNIIVNAAHAIDEKNSGMGTITIRTRRDAPWAEIQISDTGAGIPKDIQSRVFDHFFTTKQVGKGTGQGLTIAYSVIVDKHGGKLDFRSEPGQGTTFIIRLPLEAECPTDGSEAGISLRHIPSRESPAASDGQRRSTKG